MNFTENYLKEQLAKNYSAEDTSKYFEPLLFKFLKDEKILKIYFPHTFFKSWFEKNIQDNFDSFASNLFPYATINYELLKINSTHKIIEQKENLSIQTKTTSNTEYSKCSPQIPLPENLFENFLANKKNDFPVEVAKDMAKNIQNPLSNPLILYGASGSGKTHLVEAIINFIKTKSTNFNIFYGCIEEFLEIAKADNFLSQNYSSFFIDDANRIFENNSQQKNFASAIDILIRLGKPVVLTLDEHIDTYLDLSQKLRTRLKGGLVVEIKKPDLDIRRKYITEMNTEFSLGLDKNAVLTIAQRYLDFRSITGILTRIKAYKLLIKQEQTDIGTIITAHDQQTTLTPEKIIYTVAEFFSIQKECIIGKERSKETVQARQIAMYLCRDLLGLSLVQVGHIFSGRDHSSVLYSIKKIKDFQNSNKVMNNSISKLKNLCLS